jgi:hypothetical protein
MNLASVLVWRNLLNIGSWSASQNRYEGQAVIREDLFVMCHVSARPPRLDYVNRALCG